MDRYDQEVEYLKKHPKEINDAWSDPLIHRSGCLFAFVNKERDRIFENNNSKNMLACGCLTQIHAYPDLYKYNNDPELIKEIVEDSRIPSSDRFIDLEDHDATSIRLNFKDVIDSLPVMAEWQRKIDKLLDRSPLKLK